jgi:hypothetical protein
MKKTKECKLIIIENFIDYYTTNDSEREEMKNCAFDYVEEDHVDEIAQAFPELEKKEEENKDPKNVELIPIEEVGSGKIATLESLYSNIVEKIFLPNVTELDDPDKVSASWGFKTKDGRKAFIWNYKFYGEVEECTQWSVSGDIGLIKEIFGDNCLTDIFGKNIL